MKAKTLTYSRTVNLGNYNSAKLEVTIELGDEDKTDVAMETLKNYVKSEVAKDVSSPELAPNAQRRLFD